MPTPKLTSEQLEKADLLLAKVRQDLLDLSTGDRLLLFAFRRKVWKELQYDERGKPAVRKRLKLRKFKAQDGRCVHCQSPLASDGKEAVLDRQEAMDGYTDENTTLICHACDRRIQEQRGFRG